MSDEVVLRFSDVSFEYLYKKPILDEASFSVRKGAKITLMGQNGAGKSTIFNLIMGKFKPNKGTVSVDTGATVGTALQAVDVKDLDLTAEEYFAKAFAIVPPGLKSQISKVMDAVHLVVPISRKVGELSGGQQARLLLAFALIQNPDILLLDEPTNNLDQQGIEHLITFLITYNKTAIVISHDANFLNCFTEGVIYLDIFTHKIETYVGDYYSVVEEISQRIEREIKQNAQLEKRIQDRKEKVNFFSNKGGKMRKLAQKLRNETEELEENMVDVRREDKTIRPFTIPAQEIVGDIVKIHSVKIIKDHEFQTKKVDLVLRQKSRLLVSGPNGIGKSTLLKSLASGRSEGAEIMEGARVGYYSQDFSTMDLNATVYDSLLSAKATPLSVGQAAATAAAKAGRAEGIDTQKMRAIAAGFLITGDLMDRKISQLSEGQKGLLSFAQLVLLKPGLLILDEPTNHINFRHIPVITQAINEYEGAIILVSHMSELIEDIRVDDCLDLSKL